MLKAMKFDELTLLHLYRCFNLFDLKSTSFDVLKRLKILIIPLFHLPNTSKFYMIIFANLITNIIILIASDIRRVSVTISEDIALINLI